MTSCREQRWGWGGGGGEEPAGVSSAGPAPCTRPMVKE